MFECTANKEFGFIMLDLAKVEPVRRRIIQQTKNRRIKEIVVDEKDRYLFAFASIEDVKKALIGAKIIGAGRKGKYFWLELNRKALE